MQIATVVRTDSTPDRYYRTEAGSQYPGIFLGFRSYRGVTEEVGGWVRGAGGTKRPAQGRRSSGVWVREESPPSATGSGDKPPEKF